MTLERFLIEAVGILGFIANVWANILIARKSETGWIVRLFANALWLAFGIAAFSIANILSSVVFAGINVYGLRRWQRERLACQSLAVVSPVMIGDPSNYEEPADQIKCLDHGYVILDDIMGNDRTPAQTARTSFRNRKQRTVEEDAKLTSYLIKNRHTTPLEFVQLRFYVKLPIFVARQLVRHRMQSINEVSYRYVKAAREFYVPEPDRCQRAPEAGQNKQGSSSEIVDNPEICRSVIVGACNAGYDAYEELLREGLATELARVVLPVATYTEWYCQWDMHNFLHMIGLRTDSHAQYEIRVYAQAMLDLVELRFPTIINAWRKSRA